MTACIVPLLTVATARQRLSLRQRRDDTGRAACGYGTRCRRDPSPTSNEQATPASKQQMRWSRC